MFCEFEVHSLVIITTIKKQNCFLNPQTSLVLPLHGQTLPPPLTFGNHRSVSLSYSFALSRMSYK